MKPESNNSSDDRIIIYIHAELEALIPRFLANRQENVNELMSAVENRDFERIRAIGHIMKGVGGGYGFDFISTLGVSVGKAAIAKNLDDVQNLAIQLADYLQRVEVEVNTVNQFSGKTVTSNHSEFN
jgi:HPt (histidine-containing phosphotransfer) domain-containing protein